MDSAAWGFIIALMIPGLAWIGIAFAKALLHPPSAMHQYQSQKRAYRRISRW